MDLNKVKGFFVYPYYQVKLSGLQYLGSQDGQIKATGDGEICLFSDGRLLFIYETDTKLGKEFGQKQWVVNASNSDITYHFSTMDYISQFKLGISKLYIHIFLCYELRIDYTNIENEEEFNPDFMWQSMFNFKFGKITGGKQEVKIDDGFINKFEQIGYLPKLNFRLDNLEIKFRIIDHRLFWDYTGFKSILPGLGVEIGFSLKKQPLERIAKILTIMASIASANTIRIPHRRVYKNDKLVREIITTTDNERYNP